MKRTEKIKLTHRLNLRVSHKLYAKLYDMSISSGQSISDIIRMKIMGIKIPDKTGTMLISQLLQHKNELKRQGGLLKHCINTINAIGITPDVLTQLRQIANAYEKFAEEELKIFQKL